MGRWKPDARGRLTAAALDLYAERGFEQTTVVDIAERAEVTERTFFRHFTDKREVLFDGSEALQEAVATVITRAIPSAPIMETALAATVEAASLVATRGEFAQQRAVVIAANPSLQERELLKLARLGHAMATGLQQHGAQEYAAALAAEVAVAAFKVGFERWSSKTPTPDLTVCVREAFDQLVALTAEVRAPGID